MAISITIPTPPGAGQPVTLAVGKHGRTWDSVAGAVDWARDATSDRDLLFAVAIRLAADRPATRGHTLTFDATSNSLLVIT